VKVSRSDHHAGRFQGVVAEPELPDDPSVVTVVRVVGEVFTIQVCFETAVEPPPTPVCRGAWTALRCLVIIPVNSGELVPIVRG